MLEEGPIFYSPCPWIPPLSSLATYGRRECGQHWKRSHSRNAMIVCSLERNSWKIYCSTLYATKFEMMNLTWPGNKWLVSFPCTLWVHMHLWSLPVLLSNNLWEDHWKPVFMGRVKDDILSWVMMEPAVNDGIMKSQRQGSLLCFSTEHKHKFWRAQHCL